MNASLELSLYPLKENYKEQIIRFINRLKKYDNVMVQTNGMSSQIFGNYDVVMEILRKELKEEIAQKRCIVVMKMGEGLLTSDKLPQELQ